MCWGGNARYENELMSKFSLPGRLGAQNAHPRHMLNWATKTKQNKGLFFSKIWEQTMEQNHSSKGGQGLVPACRWWLTAASAWGMPTLNCSWGTGVSHNHIGGSHCWEGDKQHGWWAWLGKQAQAANKGKIMKLGI